MKPKATITVSSAPLSPTETVEVSLDGTRCGSFVVEKRLTPIDEALLLLGAERVVYDGEGDFNGARTHTLDSLKDVITVLVPAPRSLGEIRLTKVWIEEVEEYVVTVTVNGVQLGSTGTKLNYRSLQTILSLLGFDVELLGPPTVQAGRTLAA